MFKRQTKDKQLIDELKQKNDELEKEIVRLKAKISYLENPRPYELALLYQRQQVEAQKKMDEERCRFNHIHELERRNNQCKVEAENL